MIAAEFLVQMVNAAFMMVLNIYLAKKGYSDPEIADFISWRFLSVMALAFPLGLFIKGRKIIPFFLCCIDRCQCFFISDSAFC